MRVFHENHDLHEISGGSLVPTMGALHAGHLALIRRAAQLGYPVVVSIFVNPTQFGPDEDFERYPRDLESDVAEAAQAGATAVFAPDVDVMYPADVEISKPPLPPAATLPGLEDAHRPGHFEGVCQVVARLFDLLRPAVAVFGEKDYQQLRVIQQMVQRSAQSIPDRWGDICIDAAQTHRDSDDLALSSRNAYLSTSQRERALGLNVALRAAQTLAHESAGSINAQDVEQLMINVLHAHHLNIDYAVVRDAQTLLPIEHMAQPARALIAAHVDQVRLIDNAAIA